MLFVKLRAILVVLLLKLLKRMAVTHPHARVCFNFESLVFEIIDHNQVEMYTNPELSPQERFNFFYYLRALKKTIPSFRQAGFSELSLFTKHDAIIKLANRTAKELGLKLIEENDPIFDGSVFLRLYL
jgi:hypothetical protein